ncbi:MAG: response regulator, partial [Arcobacteraceae bacterium]|nr:response regulator [Arcobacteraceae bacterium]
INLINNAIKFTHSGNVKLNISNINDTYKFEIKDTGIGISKEQQSKLFKSFSQADASTTRKYGGTGLGLSISKQLVELMDGEIYCESELGNGSTFTFTVRLPKGDKNNIEYKQQIDISKITTLKNSNILLVEDNIINQEIILGILENSGINIDTANNGKEAVDMFSKNNYELILMDLQMPIMGGIEATQIIRTTKNGKDIPIIALTANAMKEDVQRTKDAGMNEHLNKPIDVDKLYETLLKYISKKVDVVTKSLDKKDNINIPTFVNIDTTIGLSYMNENKELYLKILNDFKNNYSNCNLDNLDNSEFQRVTHTIKGLSANIGAVELNKISKELDKTQDKDLLPKFYSELNLVISELKSLLVDKKNNNLLELSDEKRVELFDKLKKALNSNRPKQYKPIIEEIEQYQLDDKEEEFFNKIKSLVEKYKIADAIKLIK